MSDEEINIPTLGDLMELEARGILDHDRTRTALIMLAGMVARLQVAIEHCSIEEAMNVVEEFGKYLAIEVNWEDDAPQEEA